MMEDPAVTRPREPWAVSFGLGAVLAGCLVAAAVFMGLVLVVLSASGEALAAAGITAEPRRLAFTIGGAAALLLLLVGPSAAFGIGWLLRRVRTQSMHVIAFAVAGVVLGAVGGWVLGGPAMANVLAPMLGVSTGLARTVLSPFARV